MSAEGVGQLLRTVQSDCDEETLDYISKIIQSEIEKKTDIDPEGLCRVIGEYLVDFEVVEDEEAALALCSTISAAAIRPDKKKDVYLFAAAPEPEPTQQDKPRPKKKQPTWKKLDTVPGTKYVGQVWNGDPGVYAQAKEERDRQKDSGTRRAKGKTQSKGRSPVQRGRSPVQRGRSPGARQKGKNHSPAPRRRYRQSRSPAARTQTPAGADPKGKESDEGADIEGPLDAREEVLRAGGVGNLSKRRLAVLFTQFSVPSDLPGKGRVLGAGELLPLLQGMAGGEYLVWKNNKKGAQHHMIDFWRKAAYAKPEKSQQRASALVSLMDVDQDHLVGKEVFVATFQSVFKGHFERAGIYPCRHCRYA
jgi:hypothetical protein